MIGLILNERYKILKKLESGGFGVTYLAEDQYIPSKPKCVVKQLQPRIINPDTIADTIDRFNREAKVLEYLGKNHDKIPKLFAHFNENEQFYLIQEFIDGHDLSKEIVKGKQWSEVEVIKLLQEILEVLVFVHESPHENKVIHRDIKPSNIMRRELDNKLVLIDFGAVKEICTAAVGAEEQIRGTIIGTRGYMPPEQSYGDPKQCSDVYAVGMVGIEALTGEMPFVLPKDNDTGEVIWRDRVSVSDAFANVLEKMVRFAFQERYQSSAEALEALRSLDGNQTLVQEQNIQQSNGELEQQIEKYLDVFIRIYDHIDDFMDLCDPSVEENKQSLTDLYVQPKLSNKKISFDIYDRVCQDNQPTRFIITGGPGFGKSTFLQWIGVKIACEEQSKAQGQKWQIPVFVKLADYAYKYADPDVNPKPYKLSDYISELLKDKFRFQRTSKEVEQDIDEGRYLLLLDALDEIGNTQVRKGVWDSIDSVTNYSTSSSIITCRSAIAKQYRLQGASYTYELLQLEEEQIIEYARKTKPLLGEEKTNKLEEQIKSDSRAKTILSNPLLLYMTVGYYKNASELPPNLNVKLYADHLIKERPLRRGNNQLPENKRHKYFQNIAYQLHYKKAQGAIKEEVVEVIKKASRELELNENEADQYLDFMVEDIGLLVKIPEDKYQFIHFTFQEFFAASYYSTQISDRAELIKAAIDFPSWWLQVVVKYCDITQDTSLLEELSDQDKSIFATGIMLAVDCLTEIVTNEEISQYNPHLYNKLFQKLRDLYCNSPYKLLREQAWQKLKALGGAKVLDFISNQIDPDNDEYRQKSAIAALGEIGTGEAVETLIQILTSLKDMYLDEEAEPELIWSVIEALIATNTDEAKEEVQNLLQELIEEIGKENDELTEGIVQRLASSDLPDYINLLLNQLEQTNTPNWLQESILTELGTPSDPTNVLPKVRDVFWQRIQSAQLDVLQVVSLLNAINFSTGNDFLDYAKSLLEREEKAMVVAAIRFLSRQQDTSVTEKLLDLLYASETEAPELEKELLQALGQLLGQMKEPDESDEELLYDYMNEFYSSSLPLMEQGIVTLGQFGSQKSFDYLLNKLDNQELKIVVIPALYKISKRRKTRLNRDFGKQVLDYFKNIQHEDKSLTEAIVFILFQVGNQKQIQELLEQARPVIKKPRGILGWLEQRRQASKLPDYRSLEIGKALIEYLLKPEHDCPIKLKRDLRKWVDNCTSKDAVDDELAAEAFKLKLHLSSSKLESLQQALEDRNSICLVALENHQEFTPNELLPKLQALLNHPNPEIVTKAIELLGQRSQEDETTINENRNALLTLLEDSRYQQKAFEALAKLSGLLERE
ncbi:MAG: protein kinase [Symploca sp. SIO1B1]|nr:protein kinase [Symploca sp. SIO1B1]